ncbi:LysE family translocator [Cognatishimia sp. D5M38]|uniref:LysE family translocator n=1 Tax=Cognatishimia coralii TaxID=3083254 RepID=A0ABU8QHW0_9RHOB
MDFYLFLAFIPAAIALNLTPGADMLFCLGQGLRSGPKQAFAASAGVSMGSMTHVTIAGLGLGAAMSAFPWIFDVIRWIGVGYLLYLAVTALRSSTQSGESVRLTSLQAFRQGYFVNLSNPKVILFVLAFIPQFVDPTQGSVFVQFLMYGAIIAINGFLVNGLVGAFASGLGQAMAGSNKFQRGIGYVIATIFTALALRLAILEKS